MTKFKPLSYLLRLNDIASLTKLIGSMLFDPTAVTLLVILVVLLGGWWGYKRLLSQQ
tara:strand:+ start:1998 stop:2168 length:171 start_codon:yes stop_codon:yes gene_type:complete